MAITRLTAPSDPAAADTDWTENLTIQDALLLAANGQVLRVVGTDIVKGALFQIGGTVYIADADTAITGTASPYVKITPAGASASAAFVANLTGVTWNSTYLGWYDGSGNLFVFDEGYALADGEISEIHTRYIPRGGDGSSISGNLSISGYITAGAESTVSTGVVRWSDSKYVYWPLEIDSFASPATAPVAAAFDGTNLITSDALTNMIYIHSGVTSSVSSSFASPATSPYGLTFDGTNLISSDLTTNMIYIHSGVTSSVSSSFASPSSTPKGLAFDGTNLISCDSGTGLIYIHSGITSSVSSSFASPDGDPSGLAFDGTNLISCDLTTQEVYVHRGTTNRIVTSFTLGRVPSGIAICGISPVCTASGSEIVKQGPGVYA